MKKGPREGKREIRMRHDAGVEDSDRAWGKGFRGNTRDWAIDHMRRI